MNNCTNSMQLALVVLILCTTAHASESQKAIVPFNNNATINQQESGHYIPLKERFYHVLLYKKLISILNNELLQKEQDNNRLAEEIKRVRQAGREVAKALLLERCLTHQKKVQPSDPLLTKKNIEKQKPGIKQSTVISYQFCLFLAIAVIALLIFDKYHSGSIITSPF